MDSVTQRSFDVAVIGAGPAGIAAAVTAAESGANVALIDDNPAPGGQIWRGGANASHHPEAAHWLNLLSNSGVTRIAGTRVFYARNGALDAESDHSLSQLLYSKLILATGARELFLPFPGWTLPNVFGAGGLQALVKSGLPVKCKRVVIAGTGPLLLAVAAYLSERGARCLVHLRTSSPSRNSVLSRWQWQHSRANWWKRRSSDSAADARRTSQALGRSPHLGKTACKAVQISDNHRLREIECDYLACGFHLVPNLELARALGCRVIDGFVDVNELQETSQPGIYTAGEPTGIGGLELSIVEGQIAGYAAAGRVRFREKTSHNPRPLQENRQRHEEGFRAAPGTRDFGKARHAALPLRGCLL